MTIKVGINGFGRIGRMAFRAIAKDFSDIQVVGINDLLDADYLAYMLKYDSVHGNFDGDIAVDGNNLVVNGNKIRLTAERDPANLAWGDIGADLVIECTGFFLTEEGYLLSSIRMIFFFDEGKLQRVTVTTQATSIYHII